MNLAHLVPIRLQTWLPQTINFYKGPAIDASYQVSIHFAKRFQRRFFKIGQSETRIAYGVNLAHLVPICLQTWLPQTILVSDWLISKKSPFLKPLCQTVSEETIF
jgi:hypothetical protein